MVRFRSLVTSYPDVVPSTMAHGAPRSAVQHDLFGLDGEHRQRVSAPRVRTCKDLRQLRRPRAHSCWDHLVAAPLWPLHGANLGTLLRTCDAVGACLAVPRLPWVPEALARGNTLRRPACVHWTGPSAERWLAQERASSSEIIGVELVEGAIALGDLPAARRRTIAVLG